MEKEQIEKDNELYPLGRKVFFLNAPQTVAKKLLGTFRVLEYECYHIDNYRDAKNILSQFPSALVFVGVDSQMIPNDWFNFLMSFSSDPVLQTIHIGIITERLKTSAKEVFLTQLHPDLGLITVGETIHGTVQAIMEQLALFNAKGLRKYVRADCSIDQKAILNWSHDGKIHQMKMMDISSVGTAVQFHNSANIYLKKGDIMDGVTLMLSTRQLDVRCEIFACKKEASTTTLVLMFQNPPQDVQNVIRAYVFGILQQSLTQIINLKHQDKTDYSVPEVFLTMVKALNAKKAQVKANNEKSENSDEEKSEEQTEENKSES